MRTRIVALSAATLAVIGSFLPWASVLGVSVSGIRGDGAITAILAAGAGLVTILARSHRRIVGATNATVGALVAIVALADVTAFAAGGLYLTLIAGLGLCAVGIVRLAVRPAPPHPA